MARFLFDIKYLYEILKINLKKLLYIYILFVSFSAFSQIEQDSLPKSIEDYILIKTGDTLLIELDEIILLPKHKFKSQEDIRYYYWFRKKVFKAYPYAKLASERLDTLNARLNRIDSKRSRRKYTKLVQNYLEGEFTDQLKKMSRTEGRILIKLIHRQTGNTAFDNIKDLRSGWRAFWYNTTASIFKLSLKDEYDPKTKNEDYLIEDILQRAFMYGNLSVQTNKLPFDFAIIAAEKKGEIDVEYYKEMFAKQKKRNN